MKIETITWHELPADGMPDADIAAADHVPAVAFFGCSLHDAEKPELCQKHLHRCPEPRTVDCCGVVDEHDIIEC